MRLGVWMHGERIAALHGSPDGSYALAYEPHAVEGFGAGQPLLSMALPLRAAPHSPEATHAYVEGLLPAGRRRRSIAQALGLDPDDGFGLLAELGRDCIGAATFLPEGEEPEPADPGSLPWLGDDDLAEALAGPPGRLFGRSHLERPRFALPGQRHKLALVRDGESGRWAWPRAGLPSTHIVKPEPADRPGFAAVEMTCTSAYRDLGLPVAHAEIEEIAGVPCLVSKRFDRWGEGPQVERLHQETFAQALGISPYASKGRLQAGIPELDEGSELLRAVGDEAAVETLLAATVLDLLTGNNGLRCGDAALLYGELGPLLAPFYDIASTEIYGEVRPRPIVVGIDVPPAPFLVDLVTSIDQCGIVDRQAALLEATRSLTKLCSAIGDTADRAMREGWHESVIEDILDIALQRTKSFMLEEVAYIMPPDEG